MVFIIIINKYYETCVTRALKHYKQRKLDIRSTVLIATTRLRNLLIEERHFPLVANGTRVAGTVIIATTRLRGKSTY